MEPPCMSCEEQEPEPQKGEGETKQVDDEDAELILVGVEPVNEDDDVIFVGRTKQVDDEDAELILVGVEHVNEDDDVIFVGMTSNSKPVVSNILNRVTPGSSRRNRYGHFRKDNAQKLQPVSHVTPASEAKNVLPVSVSESRSADSSIIIEPSSKADSKNSSRQIAPNNFSELCSPLITFTSSLQHPVETAVSAGAMDKSPHVSQRLSTSETNSTSPKRPKLSDGIIGEHSLALSLSGMFHTGTTQQSIPDSVHTSLSHVQSGETCPTAFPKDNIHCKPVSPLGGNGLTKTDFPSVSSQNKIANPTEGNVIVLLRDFYYGQHIGDGQPEPKTHTAFKCCSCLKVLKNVEFMNHMKHHLEVERLKGDSWKYHTTCQHCHRQFPTPFQLQCHIESVHTSQEPCTVCKICELSFVSDQVLLQHMKDNHKPGEMPYVCQVCSYRSSFFADVDAHFRAYHGNTKNLLCPFCLQILKTATAYICHYRRHWKKSFHQCSKCRLQFLTCKEKMEHKTQCHQMFKKPKQLEGLPPETQVVIQVSLEPLQSGLVEVASITVNASDSEPSPPKPKSRRSKKTS